MSCAKDLSPSAIISAMPELNRRSFSAIGRPRRENISRLIAGVMIRSLRPILNLSMVAYRRDVADSLFPSGTADGDVSGSTPVRLLFVGDSAVSGYGVLNHGLAVVSQSARYVAREFTIGCTWTAIARPELTAEGVATELSKASLDVDVVVIIVGSADVLLGTRTSEWHTSLERAVEIVRQGPRPDSAIVFAAVPPLNRFRRLPNIIKRLFTLQVLRLNQTTFEFVNSSDRVSYSPFPRLDAFGSFIQDVYSWRSIHSHWGKRLGATIARALEPRTPAS